MGRKNLNCCTPFSAVSLWVNNDQLWPGQSQMTFHFKYCHGPPSTQRKNCPTRHHAKRAHNAISIRGCPIILHRKDFWDPTHPQILTSYKKNMLVFNRRFKKYNQCISLPFKSLRVYRFKPPTHPNPHGVRILNPLEIIGRSLMNIYIDNYMWTINYLGKALETITVWDYISNTLTHKLWTLP